MIGPDKRGEEAVRGAIGMRIKELEVELKHWRRELKKLDPERKREADGKAEHLRENAGGQT